MAIVDKVTEGIYRISTAAWGFPITLNQFLIEGEQPALIHTGTFPVYEDVRKAVAEVLDPRRLAYIVVPHFDRMSAAAWADLLRQRPTPRSCAAKPARY